MGNNKTHHDQAELVPEKVELVYPLDPFVNHSMMLGYLSGVLATHGVITPDDWNDAARALWNEEAR